MSDIELINQKINALQKNLDNPIKDDQREQAQDNQMEDKKEQSNFLELHWKKLIVLIIIVSIITLVVIFNEAVLKFLEDFIDWVKLFLSCNFKLKNNPEAGFFIMIGVYIVATVSFIPGLILTLGAGFAFSRAIENQGLAIFIATLAVWIGAQIGSYLALLLGRYVFRQAVAAKIEKYPIFFAIDKAIDSEGKKLTFLLRLSPVIPFNVFNYFMGLTGVQSKDYLIGGLGMIPGTLVYVYIGTTLGNIADLASGNTGEDQTAQNILLIVGSILALLAIIYVSIVSKRKVQEILKQKKDEEKDKKKQEEKQKVRDEQDQSQVEILDNQNAYRQVNPLQINIVTRNEQI